ncbi:unnamed protein product [Urochloa decumbens]|uniref:CHCH domain-containing protein n=2 Tax=Urochloa decumbens TaxID=240449 RepID=A0ABC8VSC7_9POAL
MPRILLVWLTCVFIVLLQFQPLAARLLEIQPYSWKPLLSIVPDKNTNSWQMSAGGAFGGNRGVRPIPPEKGVFPLDHLHECDLEKKDYLACLKSTGFQSEKCRQFSKKYLECRMERNLMAKQDMSELGFRNLDEMDTAPDENGKLESPPNEPKEKK